MPGLAGEVANLIVALKLDDSGFSGKLNAAARQLKGMDRGLSTIGRGTGQVARGIGQIADRAILAGAGLGTFAVTTAASFEQAFTGVEKTVDGTEDQLAELEGTLREMARTMPIAFEELAAIGEAGGALGVARDSLDEFVDVVARLSVSTDLSADQAATALGQLGNVLQLTGAEYESFSDILVALGNDGASTESQIIDLAARFGAAGNAAGLTNEQILTLASTTASMGIEAEAGGGALSRIFNNLTLDMATASEEGELLASTLGMSLDDLKKAWETDAGAVFEDLLAHINELDQFEGAAFLSSLGITNTRDINAIRLLSQGIDEYRDQLETANTATGALDEESQKFFDTSVGQWKILQNNVRDAAATIGAELLPVANEVMSELVGWLQEPSTQRGIKEFAENLAGGIKDLIREVKNADFGPLIETMRGAAAIAKAGFDAFNALPGPVKQLALAALVANKVTGGAVGSIAAGLGNILKGTLQLTFQRGASPANPMWVQQVGGGIGGGVAGGGKGGVVGNVLKFLPVVAAAAVASEFEDEISGFATDLREGIVGKVPTFGPKDLEWPFGSKNTPTILPEIFGGNGLLGGTGRGVGDVGAGSGNNVTFGRAAPVDVSSFDRFGDKLDKLATTEVIEHLARTNEMGLKGVGTSFQVGIADGLDPIGDIATRILARAEDPKAPAVMAEISGHISGLEEIQATYLERGDIKLADKVQNNIDTLHRLIGTEDSTRSVIQAMSAAASSNDQALIQTAQTANRYNSRTAAATEATSRKDFSFDPKITTNVTVPITNIVNSSVIQTQLHQLRTTTGSGGFI